MLHGIYAYTYTGRKRLVTTYEQIALECLWRYPTTDAPHCMNVLREFYAITVD